MEQSKLKNGPTARLTAFRLKIIYLSSIDKIILNDSFRRLPRI